MELEDRIIFKNRITQECRRCFERLGFQETTTPSLRRSLDDSGFIVSDVLNKFPRGYLRRSHGVALRSLLKTFDSVFEIGGCFRLDEPSDRHNPEFVMLEAYTHGKETSYFKDVLFELLETLEISLPSEP